MFHYVLILLALIVTNGLFAMAEIAMVSARPTRLRQMADGGSAGARVALDLAASPGRFLATIQIGITLVGVVAGAFGEATFAETLAPSLVDLPVVGEHSRTAAAGVVVVAITYVTLVIGELAPKALALRYSEDIAATLSRPMRAVSIIAAPAVWLLDRSERFVTAPFRAPRAEDAGLNRDEVLMLIDQWSKAGVLNEEERELAEGLLELGDRPVESVLKPRPDVLWLDADATAEEIRRTLERTRYSLLPVAEGSMERVIGTVSARELLLALLAGEEPDLRERAVPPTFIPSSASALQSLKAFGRHQAHMAVALDEYGVPQGILTVTDLIQVILGPLAHLSEDYSRRVREVEPQTWVVDAMASLDEFQKRTGITIPPEDRAHFQTVAGLVLNLLRELPREGDSLRYRDLTMHVDRMDGPRIDRITVKRQK